MPPDRRHYRELTVAPSLELVSTVRRFVGRVLEVALGADTSPRSELAVHEMVENADKFAVDGRATLRVETRPTPTGTEIVVATRNRAGISDVGVLERVIALFDQADD